MSLPTLTVYDTLSGAKKPLHTLEPGHVKMYVCGVTVYNLSHIGHARVFLSFDVITRYMRHRGYRVTYVRNHTDVDDKIIHAAQKEGIEPLDLASRYIDAFDDDMERLGLLPPDVAPRVSTHMPQIIGLVEKLIDRGHAYATGGDVWYAIDTFPSYGKLSRQPIADLQSGARVEVDEQKRNPLDFALWKSAKPGEPTWASPWGPGRPGWHIECSAMSSCHLGEQFDIHGGGKDLVFPHHENEIAQSEGAHGGCYAHTWMHVGLVNVDGEKMSKSLNNFWTVREVLDLFHPQTIRYFVLSAHYRKPISYSQANLELAGQRVDYLYRTWLKLQRLWTTVERPAPDTAFVQGYLDQLHAGMDDDFNSPVALAVIADVARRTNDLLETKKLSKQPAVLAQLASLDTFYAALTSIFGLLEGDAESTIAEMRTLQAARMNIDPAEVQALIEQRAAHRAAKDWAASDAVRDQLLAMYVTVMDTPTGTDWSIVSPLLDTNADATADDEA